MTLVATSCDWLFNKPVGNLVACEKNQLDVAVLLAFYRSKNHVIQFKECQDMAISGLDVISRWDRRLFTVTSQDKFLKLWKNYGKWEEMASTRGYIF